MTRYLALALCFWMMGCREKPETVTQVWEADFIMNEPKEIWTRKIFVSTDTRSEIDFTHELVGFSDGSVKWRKVKP